MENKMKVEATEVRWGIFEVESFDDSTEILSVEDFINRLHLLEPGDKIGALLSLKERKKLDREYGIFCL